MITKTDDVYTNPDNLKLRALFLTVLWMHSCIYRGNVTALKSGPGKQDDRGIDKRNI